MKILVIGNGFDLAHYLPTSYNHFMGVMAAIEKLPNDKAEIGFDDLFGVLTEASQQEYLARQKNLENKEDFCFFDRTKELYSTESMNFNAEAINTIKEKLKENSWYAYFMHHLVEIETWIDFETKIGEALVVFNMVYSIFEKYRGKKGRIEGLHFGSSEEEFSFLIKDLKILDILQLFKLIEIKYQGLDNFFEDGNTDDKVVISIIFNPVFFEKYKINFEFLFHKLLSHLKRELDKFVEVFDLYFSSIISEFQSRSDFVNLIEKFEGLTNLYSFNYTSTFLNFYKKDERGSNLSERVQVDYLHGQAGNFDKKLVLGVSDLSNEILRKHKAYGFVKYHQKLFNDTDYQFLQENEKFMVQMDVNRVVLDPEIVEICIWGHSLDISDQEYIKEIFSFNLDKDECVRVKVLYHNDSSRFSMLSNLLHIIGKELIERWMKKGWLKFELSPDIYALNTQEPFHQIEEALKEFEETGIQIECDQPAA